MSSNRIPSPTGNGIPATTVTAKGDILAATASGVVTNLAVGANNTVLTADSTAAAGVKWASAGTTFVGCALTNSGAQTLSNTTITDITFDTEAIDTDGFHSTSSNTARITIPTGKGGKYLIIARLGFAGNNTGARAMWINKNNGTYIAYCSSAPPASDVTTVQATQIADLVAGDYLTIAGYQGSGGNLNTVYDQGKTYFSVQYLGA